jgi:DegV family protein with EDD domain
VETLEFLHRGGRIGGAQRLVGTALKVKPILQVQDGRIEPVESVRTRKKSLARLAELAIERIGDSKPVYMAAIHANAPEDAEKVLETVAEKVPLKARLVTDVAPTVGTHTGPGTVGLAYMAGYDYSN